MDFNNIAIFAILGSIAAFYNQVKSFIVKFFSIFIKHDTFSNISVAQDIIKNSKIIRFGNKNYTGNLCLFVKINGKETRATVDSAKENNLLLLYKNKIPIFFSKKNYSYGVTYITGTFSLKKILDNTWDKYFENLCLIDKSKGLGVGWVENYFGSLGKKSNLDGPSVAPIKGEVPFATRPDDAEYIDPIVLDRKTIISGNMEYSFYMTEKEENNFYWSKEVLELERELKFFKENQLWFMKKNIPYKRGVLLHSSPGQGKSKAVAEVAAKSNLPLFIFHLATFTDKDLIEKLDYLKIHEKCIVLIEDIDAVFNGRENLVQKDYITEKALGFDTLINSIQGAKGMKNIFLIITTNHIEKLDPALIRPGRIDRIIEFKPLCEEGRKFIANNILSDWPELIDDLVKNTDGISTAEFENKCIELAIDQINKKIDPNSTHKKSVQALSELLENKPLQLSEKVGSFSCN